MITIAIRESVAGENCRIYVHYPGEPNPVMIQKHPLTKVHLNKITFDYGCCVFVT